MNLRQLEVFKKIADKGSITLAANELFIAQPAVSQTLKELEKQYNTQLFERLNHKLIITKSGEMLLEYANHILSLVEKAESNLTLLSESRKISLGATLTIGTYVLPRMLLYDDIKRTTDIDVFIDNTETIEQALLSAKIDVGLVEGFITNTNIVSIPFMQDEIVFFAAPFYKEYNSRRFSRFALREVGSGTREAVMQYSRTNQIAFENEIGISSTEAIKNLVKCGYCAGAMSKSLIENELEKGELIILKEFKPINRDFFISYHKDKFLTRTILDFIDEVKKVGKIIES